MSDFFFKRNIHSYRFLTDWLTQGYSDINKIDKDFKDGVLTEKTKKALLGVHERTKNQVPIEPSKLDLDFLNQKYGQCIYLSRYGTNIP